MRGGGEEASPALGAPSPRKPPISCCGGGQQQSEGELRRAFNYFDKNGDGVIDKTELTNVMRELEIAGQAKVVLDGDIDQMMEQADTDGDGEISFDEFCELIQGSDLHPGICQRCDKSQYKSKFTDEVTPWSYPLLSWVLVPLMTVIVIVGSVLYLGVDGTDGQVGATVVGICAVVVAAFAITVTCAARPAVVWAFVVYGVVVAGAVAADIVVLVGVAGRDCRVTVSDGKAVDASIACPDAIAGALNTTAAQQQCAAFDLCVFANKCSAQSAEGACAEVNPDGVCSFVGGSCVTTNPDLPLATMVDAEQHPDESYMCLQIDECRFQGELLVLGSSFGAAAVAALFCVVHILLDARHPAPMQFWQHQDQNAFFAAVRMSMDPSMHKREKQGKVSVVYGAASAKASADKRHKGPLPKPTIGM